MSFGVSLKTEGEGGILFGFPRWIRFPFSDDAERLQVDGVDESASVDDIRTVSESPAISGCVMVVACLVMLNLADRTWEFFETGVVNMSSTDLYERAERFYQERLRADLERAHLDSFVAIEPESGTFFLGRTLSEASAAASAAHPDRRCCVLRVGHSVALHIGAGS